jgi:hypothetical protein
MAYSLLGPFADAPYAIGERPGGAQIPTIPLLSGKEAWDSLASYYSAKRLDSRVGHYPGGGTLRPTDPPEEKKSAAQLYKEAGIGDRIAGLLSRIRSPKLRIPFDTPRAALPEYGKALGQPNLLARFTGRGSAAAGERPWGTWPLGKPAPELPGLARPMPPRNPLQIVDEHFATPGKTPPSSSLEAQSARQLVKKILRGGGERGEVARLLRSGTGEETAAGLRQYAAGREIPLEAPSPALATIRGNAPRVPSPARVPGRIIREPATGETIGPGAPSRPPPGVPENPLAALEARRATMRAQTKIKTELPPSSPREWMRRHPYRTTALGTAAAGAAMPPILRGLRGALSNVLPHATAATPPPPPDLSALGLGPPGETPPEDVPAAVTGGEAAGGAANGEAGTDTGREPGGVGGFLGKYWPHMAIGGGSLLALYTLAKLLRGKSKEEQERERWMQLPKLAEADPVKFAKAHPLVAGFLIKCAEDGLGEPEIRGMIGSACLIHPAIAAEFEKLAASPTPNPAVGGGGGRLASDPTQAPQGADYFNFPTRPEDAPWQFKHPEPYGRLPYTEQLPEIADRYVVARSPTGEPIQLGVPTGPYDPATKTDWGMTRSWQQYQDRVNRWIQQRRALEAQWKGMGQAGSEEFWRQMGEFQRRPQAGRRQTYPTPHERPHGVSSDEVAARGGMTNLIASRLRAGQAKGPQQPFKPEWGTLFDLPELTLRTAAEGDIYQPDPTGQSERLLADILTEQDPEFARFASARLANVPQSDAQRQLRTMAAAAREFYQPRVRLYDFVQKAYGQFGGPHTMSRQLADVPGGQAYADIFGYGNRRLWEPGPREEFSTGGEVTRGAEDPYTRIRGAHAKHRREVDLEQLRRIRELNENPFVWHPAVGASTEHFDPVKMREFYESMGHSPMDAAVRAANDRYRLMRPGPYGESTSYWNQLGNAAQDPKYWLRNLAQAGEGTIQTMMHLKGAPLAAAEYTLGGSDNPEALKQYARGLAGAAMEPLEELTGSVPEGQTYFGGMQTRYAPLRAAGRNPKKFRSATFSATNFLANMEDLRRQRPDLFNEMLMEASKVDPRVLEDPELIDPKELASRGIDPGMLRVLRGAADLERQQETGQLGYQQQLAERAQESGPLQRLGWRLSGTAGEALPTALAFHTVGGPLKGFAKWTAMAPAFEAGQHSLDELGVGQYQRAIADKWRQEGANKPWASRAERSMRAAMLEDPTSAIFMLRGMPWRQKPLIPPVMGASPAEERGPYGAALAQEMGMIPYTSDPRLPPELFAMQLGLLDGRTTPPPEPNNPNLPRQAPAGGSSLEQLAQAPGVDPQRVAGMPPQQRAQVPGALQVAQRAVASRSPDATNAAMTEILSPDPNTPADQAAQASLAQQLGTAPAAIVETYQGMDPGAKLALWLGLGIGAIGLLGAIVDDDAGMLPLLLGLGGLGIAGGAAAHGGVFGQGAQALMQQIFGGGSPAKAPPPPDLTALKDELGQPPAPTTPAETPAKAAVPPPGTSDTWLDGQPKPEWVHHVEREPGQFLKFLLGDNKIDQSELDYLLTVPGLRRHMLGLPSDRIDQIVASSLRDPAARQQLGQFRRISNEDAMRVLTAPWNAEMKVKGPGGLDVHVRGLGIPQDEAAQIYEILMRNLKT